MKKTFFILSLLVVMTLACNLSASVDPSPTPLLPDATIPVSEPTIEIPTVIPDATLTPVQSSVEGIPVFYRPLNFVLPIGLANGISGSQFSRNEGEGVSPWDVTPGHTQIKLEGYLLQGKFHQPQIYLYPATPYGEMYPGAFESMHRLRNVMNDPGAPISVEQLPAVPFFNAAQIFASNFQAISFQNGQGVRFLTEYAQYFAPVNNHELVYHFQGFTNDGEYYIVAIFPITEPALAETSEPGAFLPSGGVAYPDINDPNADFQSYYTAVTALLNATPPDAFSPTITQLDLLIQSMQVTP